MSTRRSKAAEPGDQRQGQRFTLLLRAAKLVTSTGEFLCLVRDVSDGGLKIKLFHPLVLDAPCEIEFGNGDRVPLECVWQRDDQAGFRYARGPIAAHRLIDEGCAFPKRHLRLRLIRPLPLLVTSGGLCAPGQLCDISQHGAAIALDRRLPVHSQARIDTAQFAPLHARVRWRRGGMHGLVFQQGFRLDELAQLAWRLQLAPDSGEILPESAPVLTIN